MLSLSGIPPESQENRVSGLLVYKFAVTGVLDPSYPAHKVLECAKFGV